MEKVRALFGHWWRLGTKPDHDTHYPRPLFSWMQILQEKKMINRDPRAFSRRKSRAQEMAGTPILTLAHSLFDRAEMLTEPQLVGKTRPKRQPTKITYLSDYQSPTSRTYQAAIWPELASQAPH